MRLLDLFCGAGGAAKGYADAGFEVIGVDIKAQQSYPYEFIKMDALRALSLLDLRNFDAVHASPPCQAHSTMRFRNEDVPQTGDFLPMTRNLLKTHPVRLPWVIENVPGAPMNRPVTLCGSMFGLDVRRHRLFETNWKLPQPECDHGWQVPRFRNPDPRGKPLVGVVNVHGSPSYAGEVELRKKAMGIDWMTNRELTQAVPPAYTLYVGEYLMEVCERKRVAA